MLGILLRKIGQRIDGIAWTGHMKLHITGPKVKIIRYSQLHHAQPVKFMDQRFSLFQRILRTDHKPDLIQVRSVVNRLRNDQMTKVDGIEAAEKKPNVHGLGS